MLPLYLGLVMYTPPTCILLCAVQYPVWYQTRSMVSSHRSDKISLAVSCPRTTVFETDFCEEPVHKVEQFLSARDPIRKNSHTPVRYLWLSLACTAVQQYICIFLDHESEVTPSRVSEYRGNTNLSCARMTCLCVLVLSSHQARRNKLVLLLIMCV